jgi:hypothetical protein
MMASFSKKTDQYKLLIIVHTMWQYPNMLPKLYTWGPVVAKLMEGAGKITSN